MASGDTLAVFFPQDGEPPSTVYATVDARSMSAGSGVILVLDYDDTTDESMDFSGFMPRHYGGGGITVSLGLMFTSAVSGTASVDIAFMSVSSDADDLDTKSYAAANNTAVSAVSTSGNVGYATIAFTDGADMDSIAAGEHFRMRVTRDADGTTSTDNASGDMELVFVEIQET